ncbi:S8 family serine peptidase [Owenweeksia hongkongensis]|uniref:S8 family serine peptidase n=1 Tax=Owenweeksia hongkongensis TaxID=253245 RepID=UPI003A8CAB3F
MLATPLISEQVQRTAGPSARESQHADQNERPQAEPIVARAVGSLPTPRTVKIVAQEAEPIQFNPELHPNLGSLTGLRVIRMLCGTATKEYIEALKEENGIEELNLDTPLEEKAYELYWPACLYAETNHERLPKYEVQSGDTPGHIMRVFTGKFTNDESLRKYINATFGRAVKFSELTVGEKVAPPWSSLPTFLISRNGDNKKLVTKLNTAQGSDVVAEMQRPGGEIIGPARLSATGQLASGEFPDCVNSGQEEYPFVASAVASAYRYAHDLLVKEVNNPRSIIHLVVVDNGFFGVPCEPDSCPQRIEGRLQFTKRFPPEYFDQHQFPLGSLGPKTRDDIKPINYWNGLRNPDVETGHGTHVAGIAIGGPSFVAERDVFEMDRSSWMKLVIANLSAGKKTFAAGSEEVIFDYINKIRGKKIVNLSLTIDDEIRPGAADLLRRLISVVEADTLFIAAAGNNGKSLGSRKLYPARFGGRDGSISNVITVVSIDSNGQISKFSNRGSKFADIAAPGCKIDSWINAKQPKISVSGTSQAAPMVSFTSAMLRSLWDVAPSRLKSRLIYSGSLIKDPNERRHVDSGLKLNPVSALLVRRDVITFEVPSAQPDGEHSRITLIGKLGPLQGYACVDGQELASLSDVRAFKREGESGLLIWRASSSGKNEKCVAKIKNSLNQIPNQAEFIASHILEQSGLTKIDNPSKQYIDVERITDIVRSEPDLRRF